MNKIISTIFMTIILINSSLAKRGNAKERNPEEDRIVLENMLKNMEESRQTHLSQFQAPSQYYECGPEARVRGEGALVSAHKKYAQDYSIPIQNLKDSACEYGKSNDFHWAKFTYVNEDNKTCTAYSVFRWVEPRNKKQKTPIIFELEAEFTEKANEGLTCKTPEENPTKIQIDEKSQVTVHEEPQVVHETIQVFGPSHTRLPAHPQIGKEVPSKNRNELSMDDEDMSESNDQTDASIKHDEHDPMINKRLMGGWVHCEPKDSLEVPKVFAMLIAQNKLAAITVYTQNVVRCEKQLVNGMNYNLVMSFNGKECQIQYNEAFTGPITLMNSSNPYHDVKLCTEVYSSSK